MKNLFFGLLFIFSLVNFNTAFCQYSKHIPLGGSISYTNNTKSIVALVNPGIGFFVNEKVSIGLTLNSVYNRSSVTTNSLSIHPDFFGRFWWDFKKYDNLFVFVQAQTSMFSYQVLDANKKNVNSLNFQLLNNTDLCAGTVFKVYKSFYLETGLSISSNSKFVPFIGMQWLLKSKTLE
ncbi:MAG: hypothetical protein ACK48W_12390 [Bacteroidota bacterium]|jgi:hypothetical protein